MAITFTLSEEDYQLLIQMLVNSNPIIQKIAQQANPQIAAQQQPAKTPEVVRPAEAKPEPKGMPSFERERR